MALPRKAIEDFQIANEAYIGAQVTFYVANPDGTASATKATLYNDLSGIATLANPQTLDSNGKFMQPVYTNVDVVGSVSAGGAGGDTGVIGYGGGARGVYVTATRYFTHDWIIGPAGQVPDVSGNLYLSNTIFDSTTWAVDLANLTLQFNYQALLGAIIPFSTIAQTQTGTSTTTTVTPDSLASIWQKGSDLASAATLVKPADASLGGYYVVTGNVQIDNIWAAEPAGREIVTRFTGTPIIGAGGNIVPPGAAAYQIVAGTVIHWRWDGATLRVVSGIQADGSPLIGAASLVASCRNLYIRNNTGTPNSQLDYSADEVILKTAGGLAKLYSAVSGTINIAVAGADGLDTGAEASSTWYYVWGIGKADGTFKAVVSASAAAPTLPAGYTIYGLLAAIYNDSGSNFRLTRVRGRAHSQTAVAVLTHGVAGAANTWQAGVSIAVAVPPNAKTVGGNFGNDTATNDYWAMAVSGNAAGVGAKIVATANGTATQLFTRFSRGAPFSGIMLDLAQTIYWAGLSTSAYAGIDITEFEI